MNRSYEVYKKTTNTDPWAETYKSLNQRLEEMVAKPYRRHGRPIPAPINKKPDLNNMTKKELEDLAVELDEILRKIS